MDRTLAMFNLQSNPDLGYIAYSSEEEWLRLRTSGIGGSDAGAIMGINKHSSPRHVYYVKEGIFKEDLSDNVYIKKGKTLEPVIRENFVKPYMAEKGYRVTHPEGYILVNSRFPWLQANLDGIAVPEDPTLDHTHNIVIEIKWVSQYGEENWYGDSYGGIPASYYAQVQHYMAVTGARRAIVCALFDSTWEMHYFDIAYDETFALSLIAKAKTFVQNNLDLHIPPPIIPSLDGLDPAMLSSSKVYRVPELVEDKLFAQEVREYIAKREELSTLEKQLDSIKDNLIEHYLEGKRCPKDAEVYMSISTHNKTTFDASGLLSAHPELDEEREKYTTTKSYTVTRIRKKR